MTDSSTLERPASTYELQPSHAVASTCVLTCSNCRDWRPEAIAYPHLSAPGSQRVCAKDRISSAGQWCREWEAQTAEQHEAAAHGAGRLF